MNYVFYNNLYNTFGIFLYIQFHCFMVMRNGASWIVESFRYQGVMDNISWMLSKRIHFEANQIDNLIGQSVRTSLSYCDFFSSFLKYSSDILVNSSPFSHGYKKSLSYILHGRNFPCRILHLKLVSTRCPSWLLSELGPYLKTMVFFKMVPDIRKHQLIKRLDINTSSQRYFRKCLYAWAFWSSFRNKIIGFVHIHLWCL